MNIYNHDSVSAGHTGYYKTYLAVREKYYWPRMSRYILRYANTCELCQHNKARQTKPPGLLQSVDIPNSRCIDITMNILVSFPATKDILNLIMIIVDRLTKRAKVIATKSTDDSNDIANVFMENYVKGHDMLKPVVSDRDTKFTSTFWQTNMTAMETQHNLASAFLSQTEGQTERTNHFIRDYLRGGINPAQDYCDEYTHLVAIANNGRVHSTIEMSPLEADLGYILFMSDDVSIDPEFKKLVQPFLLRQQTRLRDTRPA
ncbi:Retrotransposon Polyprotein [Phytophthora megakarya]|uniref:Retrotransposon Polyprotein n=1 Tax=Phytophthora megakarya TaxID=4795 RepID=A0A225VSD7_9STRA|nr:Retrotransposon Polyprotein [Phytophthora megakarya]